MKNQTIYLLSLFLFITIQVSCQSPKIEPMEKDYPTALVSYDDYKKLVADVESHRLNRLISLDTFIKMSQEENTVILDTRSEFRYNRKHLKGAKHFAFTDFTQANLRKLIPDPTTRILIYCNNNFDGDQIDFASKSFAPKGSDGEILPNRTPIMLALNIPTYLNLYGYGYRNVYELHELVNVGNEKIEFEGTEVLKVQKVDLIKLVKQK